MTRTVLSRAGLGISSASLASAATISAAFGQQVAANDQTRSLETVTVTDQRVSIGLLPEKVLDTPQSVNVIPAQVMKEQGVTNLQDALKNVPGITLNAGEGGTHGDLVNLRGFPAGDDYFLDGLRDTGLYSRDTFDYESLEVLKGPASTLFGRGTTGGAINQVSKSPQLYPVMDFALTGGTNGEARGTADMNYVLDDLVDDTAAARLNLMGQRNNFVGRNFARTQKWGAAPSFAYGLGTDTVWTLQYLHEQEDSIPDSGIPFLFGTPAPVDHRAAYSLPADDRFKTDVEVVTGKVKHKFDDVFSVSEQVRYGSYWFDSRQTNPIYGGANCFTNTSSPYYFSGGALCSSLPAASRKPTTVFNPLFPTAGTPLSAIFIERDRPSSKGTIATLMSETDLNADFETGFIQHHATVGVEVDNEAASLTRFANQNTVIPPTPLLAPNPFEAFPGTQTTVNSRPVTKTSTLGLFATDTVDIGEHWSLVGAIRFDHFGARFDQTVGTQSHFTHKDNIGSPRAAVVYKPDENSSVYFSYGTSFNPSAETLTLAASNQGLGPERDHTYEVGGKINVLDGQLALTAAAFNTVKTNARISDPLNPGLQSLAGTERMNGVEFGAQGHITENWELIAGYTYLAPRAVGLIAVGVPGPIPNVARNQANLWSVYDFDSGLHIGGGLNWTGSREAGADNLSIPGTIITSHLPSYVTVDAMVSYQVTDYLTLQLNAYNLGNEFYYATSYDTRPNENHAVPGAGRTFLLTAGLSL
jgi:catecholate siderophore receptor